MIYENGVLINLEFLRKYRHWKWSFFWDSHVAQSHRTAQIFPTKKMGTSDHNNVFYEENMFPKTVFSYRYDLLEGKNQI